MEQATFLEESSLKQFFSFSIVDIIMRSWAHINSSLLRSVCGHEIYRRLSRPFLIVIVPRGLVWILQPDGVRKMKTPVPGVSFSNVLPSCILTKVAIQPSRMSIAAFLSQSSPVSLLSRTLSWEVSRSMHFLLFPESLSSRPTRWQPCSQFDFRNRTRFHPKHFFSRKECRKNFKATHSTVFEPRPFIHKGPFEVLDYFEQFHFWKYFESTSFKHYAVFHSESIARAFWFQSTINPQASRVLLPLRSSRSSRILNCPWIQILSRIATGWLKERKFWVRREAGMWTAYNCSSK